MKRSELLLTNLWMTLGFVGFHAASTGGHNLSAQGRLGALAMGASGVLGFLAVFTRMAGGGLLRDAMLSRWQQLRSARVGPGSFVATLALSGSALAVAGWVGDVNSEVRHGLLEGIRNGVFLTTFAYIMRFRLGWGIASGVAWAAMDIAAFAFAGGSQKRISDANGVVMMGVGLLACMILLTGLAALDDSVSGKAEAT